ncbi:hypothetical protein RJ55_06296 [Drechmeria coniospora]|nr:hypothetical protein RJ55_06296 [Drechmeria coniospora]
MEPTTIGGNTTSSRPPCLGQPTDAVPMENMTQSTDNRQDPARPDVDVDDDDAAAAAADRQPPPESTANPHRSSPRHSELPVKVETDGRSQPSVATDAWDEPVPPPPSKEASDSMAIGPAQDDVRAVAPGGTDGGPVCNITLLLTSGGRHPYKLDAKYLARRNVVVPDETESGRPDPFSISVYTLKELILREWRSDWEAKPASPSSIRLIHFGKLLDDKEQLKKYQFGTESPNVIHMSIRPADLDDEAPKSGSKSLAAGSADGQRAGGGSRCCVIL